MFHGAKYTKSMATVEPESLCCISGSNCFIPAQRTFVCYNTGSPTCGSKGRASPMVWMHYRVRNSWLRKLRLKRWHHIPVYWGSACSWHQLIQDRNLRCWILLLQILTRWLIVYVTLFCVSIRILWSSLVISRWVVDLRLSWCVKVWFRFWVCDCHCLANQTPLLVLQRGCIRWMSLGMLL